MSCVFKVLIMYGVTYRKIEVERDWIGVLMLYTKDMSGRK